MDPTLGAALFAFLTVLVQSIANQYGAKKAMDHELAMEKLKLQRESDDEEERDDDRDTKDSTSNRKLDQTEVSSHPADSS